MHVAVKKIELRLLCVYNYRDVYDAYTNQYYVKPWCRMGPYIIGILFGYLLYKTKSKLRINKVRKITHRYFYNLFLFYFIFLAHV